MNTIFIMILGFDYLPHLQDITYIKLTYYVLFTLNNPNITYFNKVLTYFYTNLSCSLVIYKSSLNIFIYAIKHDCYLLD